MQLFFNILIGQKVANTQFLSYAISVKERVALFKATKIILLE
jgi:hypothetical protein